jgi:hypothetical protein
LKKQEVAKYELNIKKLMKGRIDLFAGPGDIVKEGQIFLALRRKSLKTISPLLILFVLR